MTKRRQRDRRTAGQRGQVALVREPAEPDTSSGPVIVQDVDDTSAPPGAGQDPSHPPAPGGASTVTLTKLSEAAALVANSPTPAAVDQLRAELVVSLARALEIATEAGDVDLILKTADRLTKLLPAASTKPTPEPPGGGVPDGDNGAGAPSPAERFRLLSGPMGN